MEHKIGWRRMLVVAMLGHVLVSLGVALAAVLSIQQGWLPKSAARTVDVGASYAFASICGAFTYLLRKPLAITWVIIMMTVLAGLIWLDPSSDNIGHASAVVIGLCCATIVRRGPTHPAVQESSSVTTAAEIS